MDNKYTFFNLSLPNDYGIELGMLYKIGDRLIISPINGTVAELQREHGINIEGGYYMDVRCSHQAWENRVELSLPNRFDTVVLHGGKIMGLSEAGNLDSVMWVAKTPQLHPTDYYVSVYISGGRIYANSFSCYFVNIDPLSGKILAMNFTK